MADQENEPKSVILEINRILKSLPKEERQMLGQYTRCMLHKNAKKMIYQKFEEQKQISREIVEYLKSQKVDHYIVVYIQNLLTEKTKKMVKTIEKRDLEG